MTQTDNRFFDDFSKLVTDAAGLAQGLGREVETAARARFDAFIADLDLVRREDFEAVRELAATARSEAEALKARVEALEARLATIDGEAAPAETRIAGEPNDPTVG
jgi:BMFP domain-containing protein YqiC